jgi:hypothetical protein
MGYLGTLKIQPIKVTVTFQVNWIKTWTDMAEMSTIVEGNVKYRDGKKVIYFLEHVFIFNIYARTVLIISFVYFSGNQDGAL